MPRKDITNEIQVISSNLRNIGYNVSVSTILDAGELVCGRIISHDNSYNATFLSNGNLNIYIRGDSDFSGFIDSLLKFVNLYLPAYSKNINIF